jgi:hypothetical protein
VAWSPKVFGCAAGTALARTARTFRRSTCSACSRLRKLDLTEAQLRRFACENAREMFWK